MNNKAKVLNYKKEEAKATSQPTVYRKGKKPNWMEESESEKASANNSEDDIFSNSGSEDVGYENAEENIANINLSNLTRENKDDGQFNVVINSNDSKGNEGGIRKVEIRPRREIYKSEIVVFADSPSKPVEKIDLSQRRQRVGVSGSKVVEANEEDKEDELLSLLGESESEINNVGNEINTEESESDSAPESEDEEEEEVLMRPVFVSKDERVTLNALDNEDLTQMELKEEREKTVTLRKRQTKEIVKKIIEEEENKEKSEAIESISLPDDTDDLDDLDNYEQWKVRELRRIKVQFEESEKKLKEKLEIDRRRKLTDLERKEENLRLGSDDTLRPFKSKLNFLQKYYHKGVFYQQEGKEDLEHIYNRDYNLPTWEDKVDRSAMPKLLQVRRGLQFKKGRSKYTHLTSEDTTNFDPNFKTPDFIFDKLRSSQAGYKAENDFDLSKRKRK